MFAIAPPVEPMLAKVATDLPEGNGFLYEPKWDGFRAIVFRGGDKVFIQSRDLKPLDRYFPELSAALLEDCPTARSSMAKSSLRLCEVSTSTRCRCVCILPRRARQNSPKRLQPRSWPSTCSRPEGMTCAACRKTSGASPRAALAARAAVNPFDPDDARPGAGARVVVALRRGWAGRRHGQAGHRDLPAGQARDDQGEARPHGRLCRRRFPLAQGRERRAHRIAAPRPLRRAAAPAARRRDLSLHDGDAPSARHRAGAAAQARPR